MRLGRAWLAGILLLAASLSAAAEPRRVLLLHSFGPHFAPWNEIAAQFRTELIKQSPDPIDLYEVSLQFGRYAQPQDEAPLISYLGTLFPGSSPDLLVAVGAPAARFLLKNRAQVSSIDALAHQRNGRAHFRQRSSPPMIPR